MDQFIARANIDHYLDLLHNNAIPARNKATISKLLIEEENKLSHDIEQLEFAERKATACRDRLDRQRRLRECFAAGSTDRVQAERVLVSFEATLQLVEGFCAHMRKKVIARS